MREQRSDLESQRHTVPEVRNKSRNRGPQKKNKGKNAKQESPHQQHTAAKDARKGKGKGKQGKSTSDDSGSEWDIDRDRGKGKGKSEQHGNNQREWQPDDATQSGNSTTDSEWASSDGNDTTSEVSSGGWTASDGATSNGSDSNATNSEWDQQGSVQSQETNAGPTKGWTASDGMSTGGSDASVALDEIPEEKNEKDNATSDNGPEADESARNALDQEWGASGGQTTHDTSVQQPSPPKKQGHSKAPATAGPSEGGNPGATW